jgi:hypothetical protein
MKGDLYVIIETPDSRSEVTLSHAVSKEESICSTYFLFPEQTDFVDLPCTHWQWEDKQFNFEVSESKEINEWFLFLSNTVDLADQIEAIILLLEENKSLSLSRIITFIDSNVLINLNVELRNWLDACAHFSDVFCFSGRKNNNSNLIKQITDRYESLHYPLETYILGGRKAPPINRILSAIPKRISHVFDPPEILEPDDQPQNDPFLAQQPNGNRKVGVPNPFRN